MQNKLDRTKVAKGQYKNAAIERLKKMGCYKALLSTIRALRCARCTDEELVTAINGAFNLIGMKMTVNDLKKSLFAYSDLGAAYLLGKDYTIGLAKDVIDDVLTTSERNEKLGRFALDVIKELDDRNIVKTEDMKEGVTLTATGQTLANLVAALGPVDEPTPPDESDLDFDKQAESEADAASQSYAFR